MYYIQTSIFLLLKVKLKEFKNLQFIFIILHIYQLSSIRRMKRYIDKKIKFLIPIISSKEFHFFFL